MKKTSLFLYALCIGLLFPVSIVKSDNTKPIDLYGELQNTGARSLSPITAIQYPDFIEVTLSKFLGEISIWIYDEANNIVYKEKIDTSIQSDLYIDTTLFESGIYTIVFMNSQNGYLSGRFEI